MTPLVTVGLTAYDAEATIVRAIDSIIAQTWKPIEVIVVDDCSSDLTWEILEGVINKNSFVRAFRNSRNSGVAVSRNRIIKEANGEFVIFFDDDDYSLPTRIEEQLDRIVNYEKEFANGEMVICHTARNVLYPDGRQAIEKTMGQLENRIAPNGLHVAKRILLGDRLYDGDGACPTCSQMARLSTYRELEGFDENLRRGEDTEFNIRLALAGGHFVGIAGPLVEQCMTKTSEKSLKEEYRNMLLILDKHKNFLAQHGRYEFTLKWMAAKQYWLENKKYLFFKQMLGLILRHPVNSFLRARSALPNMKVNQAFSRFHMQTK